MLQQLLPFTVLKHILYEGDANLSIFLVATALTVYGIETNKFAIAFRQFGNVLQQLLPFTVLKL